MVCLEYVFNWLVSILLNITHGLGKKRSKNVALGGETWRGRKWVTVSVLSLGEKLVEQFFLICILITQVQMESACSMTAMNQFQGHCFALRS